VENSLDTNETTCENNDLFAPVRQVALIFFILLGGTHILTGLMASNNYLLPISNIINKVLDIPFAIIAASYGLSNIKIASNSPHKNLIYTLIGLTLLSLLLILLYINIFIPNRI